MKHFSSSSQVQLDEEETEFLSKFYRNDLTIATGAVKAGLFSEAVLVTAAWNHLYVKNSVRETLKTTGK